jgi:hypothetical protein
MSSPVNKIQKRAAAAARLAYAGVREPHNAKWKRRVKEYENLKRQIENFEEDHAKKIEDLEMKLAKAIDQKGIRERALTQRRGNFKNKESISTAERWVSEATKTIEEITRELTDIRETKDYKLRDLELDLRDFLNVVPEFNPENFKYSLQSNFRHGMSPEEAHLLHTKRSGGYTRRQKNRKGTNKLGPRRFTCRRPSSRAS